MYKYTLLGIMRVRLVNDISLEGLTNLIKYVSFVSEVISPLPCAYVSLLQGNSNLVTFLIETLVFEWHVI
jgi:hypothetical protein